MKTTSLIIVLLLAAASCAKPESTTPDSSTSKGTLEKAPDSPTEDPPIASDHERTAKKVEAQKSPAGPVAQEVDWAEAAGFARVEPAHLKSAERDKLQKIRVPVLVPDDPALLQTTFIAHNEDWYTAALEGDGINLHIRGTRNAFRAPAMELPEAARKAAENYTLTRTHQIVTVSWRAFGVSYSLDVECAKPMDDTRCTEDEFALRLAESLGVVGGSR